MTANAVAGGLRVAVRLDGLLSRSAAPDEVTAEVTRSIGELATTFGMPASPEVTVFSGDAVVARPGLRLWVGDRLLLCSDALFSRAVGSVHGELPTTDVVTDDQLSAMDGADLTALIRLVCAETVKRRPSAFATADTMTAYARRLAAESRGLADGWADRLSQVVTSALSLGISVADVGAVAEALQGTQEDDVVAAQENVISALAPETIQLFVPREVLPAMGSGDSTNPDDLVGFVGTGMFEELGVVFPPIVVGTASWLPEGTFAIRINHVTGMPHAMPGPGEIVVNEQPDTIGAEVATARPVLLPATDKVGSVVPAEFKHLLEDQGWTTWDGPGYVILQLAAAMRTHAAAVITQDRLLAQLDALEADWSAVVRAARDELAPARLTALVRRLVRGGVPLRHLPRVLDRMVDLPASTLGELQHVVVDDAIRFDACGMTPGDQEGAESFLRRGMRDHIAQAVSQNPGVVTAYLLDKDIEQALAGEMDEPTQEGIVAAIRAELDELPRNVRAPVVLTREPVRANLQWLVSMPFPLLRVVAHEDLPADLLVQPVARISLASGGA